MSGKLNIAIIPARGGSKGIPKKNIALLQGKPLIVHTIEAALKAETVSHVVVSTDDAEIAAVSEKAGARVVMRPAEISGDTASSEAALIHTITYLGENLGLYPDTLTFLQCTSPMTIAEDIDGTYNKMAAEGADSALAVSRFFHFLWKDAGQDGAIGTNHDKSFRLRRQDAEPQYLETGSVYVMKTEGFLQHKHRFFGKTVMHEIDADRVFEIDEPHDLVMAEMLMAKFTAKNTALPEKIEAIVFDFDGVFTDNKVIVFQNGEEAVICDRGDGMGISLLKAEGIKLWVISKERNPVLKARCEKLGIECFHQVDNKLEMFKQQLEERNINVENTLFVGNDINDVECLTFAGCGVVVGDSHPSVFKHADLVLKGLGGKGAIRELADMITNRKG